MNTRDFTYCFESSRPRHELFATLLDVRQWWSGIFAETIEGKSEMPGDEFRFVAGGGAHDTTKKLVELIPDTKIDWLVTRSHLSFAEKTDEWTGTRFYFNLSESGNNTLVCFTHEGLQPELACYQSCTGGWMQYLKRLELKLK